MLLMIRKAQDARVRSVVSTLIFNPVDMNSADDDDGTTFMDSGPVSLPSHGQLEVEMTSTGKV
jgi:hypothetical protein